MRGVGALPDPIEIVTKFPKKLAVARRESGVSDLIRSVQREFCGSFMMAPGFTGTGCALPAVGNHLVPVPSLKLTWSFFAIIIMALVITVMFAAFY
jgi:hypothetical protein